MTEPKEIAVYPMQQAIVVSIDEYTELQMRCDEEGLQIAVVPPGLPAGTEINCWKISYDSLVEQAKRMGADNVHMENSL